MARPVLPLTRRQFLVGASGFTLALPILSSLLVDKAYGADPVFVRRPRLYWLTTNHGAAFESAFFPSESPLTDSRPLFADHSVAAGALRAARASSASTTLISQVLQAPSNAAAPAANLAAQRPARDRRLVRPRTPHRRPPRQLRAQRGRRRNRLRGSKRAAPHDRSAARLVALVLRRSHAGSRARDRDGNARDLVRLFQSIDGDRQRAERPRRHSSLELFHRIFVPAGAPTPARVPVVDRVLESYAKSTERQPSLVGGRSPPARRSHGPAFGAAAQVERHASYLVWRRDRAHRRQRPAHAASIPRTACVTRSSTTRSWRPRSAAAQAGSPCWASPTSSASSTLRANGTSTSRHYWLDPAKQDLLQRSYRRIFESVFLDMASRLDSEEADGRATSTTRCSSGRKSPACPPTIPCRCRSSPPAARPAFSARASRSTTAESNTPIPDSSR